MTKLEMAALALANEVESNIQVGVPITANLVLALNEFRKAQIESDKSFGADLDAMYRQWFESEHSRVSEIINCPVIDIYQAKRNKIKPV